jgi:hypothetical protein
MATTVGQHSVASFTSPINNDPLNADVVRGNDNTLRSAYVDHDADTGIHLQSSTLASRPAAGTAGRKWMTTDTGSIKVWYDNGSTWEEISYVAPTTSTLTVTGDTRLATTSGNVGVGTASPAASAKMHTVVADGTYSVAASGTTKGIRLEHNATDARVVGVDNTLVGSYQPLGLDGSKLNVYTGNTQRWEVQASGHIVPAATNTYDLGTAGTTVRNGYFANVSGNGSGLTALNASNLASGTIPDARFPATLPAAVTASSLTSVGSLTALTVAGTTTLQQALEKVTVSATAATGTINYDALTQAVLYYTTNATANWTVNFRGNAGTALSSVMANGQALTVVFLVTTGATPYYASAHQVDGSSITPKWLNNAAVAAGNANSIEAYTYTIIKTAAGFTLLAARSQFA